MNRKLLIFFMILIAAVSLGAVSAEDNITDIAEIAESQDEVSEVEVDEEIGEENSEELAGEDSDEEVIGEADTSPVYEANSSSSDDDSTVVTPSKISASSVVGYTTFSSTLTAKLTSGGKALASKTVKIIVNGVTYKKVTNSKGKVSLSVKLPKGTYKVKFYYAGDNLTGNATATSKLTVKNAVKTSFKIGDKYINYRQGSKCLFYVKLLDKNGKALKNKLVTIKVNGKTYKVKTTKKGNAKIYLNLKKGTYKVKYSFKKSSPYLASSGSCKIKFKSKMAKGNGYWLWASHMKSVNLKSLSKKGTKHIFLLSYAVYQYGKSSVVSFIKKAHKYGMKVHLWMQVCYEGEWISPVNKDHTIKYWFLNKKIRQAKSFAKIKGVDGIHFDYMRFGGTAHKYKTAAKAINYFAKKASYQIHKIKSNAIVSAAIMPEPSMMEYYYGQDVPVISRYLDALLPMVYKGNYHKSSSWIKSVTKTFVKQSNGAQVWTGLQAYHSDSNINTLSQKALLKDAKAAKAGGAKGVILFRYGLSCNFNFNKV